MIRCFSDQSWQPRKICVAFPQVQAAVFTFLAGCQGGPSLEARITRVALE